MSFLEILQESLKITMFVFMMMVLVDLLNVKTQKKLELTLKGSTWKQYLTSSFLGVTPGCWGAFADVSLYVHGLLTFGAIVGGMIATSGDEAFVMLAVFPRKAVVLFGLLFLFGIVFAGITDKIATPMGIKPCEECEPPPAPETPTTKHYVRLHVWEHIVKRHIVHVFIWTFLALLFIGLGFKYFNLEAFVSKNLMWVLIIAAVAGLVPESGPHLVFVMMFAQGLIPLSVLLVSSIVQDGHGMLPLFSYTVKDSVLIKTFNFIYGLGIGGLLYIIGI